MSYLKERPQQLEYLARINSDDFTFNKSQYKQKFYYPSTVKSNRLINKNYPRMSPPVFKQDTKVNYDNYKQSQRLKNYKKDKERGLLRYEPVSRTEGKYRGLTLNMSEKYQKIKQLAEKRLTTQIYSSIEDNLSQCDKILMKLRHVTLDSVNNGVFPHSIKSSPVSIRKIKQWGSASLLNQEKIRQFQNNLSRHDFDSRNNKHFEYSLNPSKAPSPMSHSDLLPHSRTLSTQGSVMQLRRQRIEQIIQTRKSRVENPLEHSHIRMKARGQKMFNKVMKGREPSLDRVNVQQIY